MTALRVTLRCMTRSHRSAIIGVLLLAVLHPTHYPIQHQDLADLVALIGLAASSCVAFAQRPLRRSK